MVCERARVWGVSVRRASVIGQTVQGGQKIRTSNRTITNGAGLRAVETLAREAKGGRVRVLERSQNLQPVQSSGQTFPATSVPFLCGFCHQFINHPHANHTLSVNNRMGRIRIRIRMQYRIAMLDSRWQP